MNARVVTKERLADWGREDAVGSRQLVAGPCRIVCRDGRVRQATVALQKLSDCRTLAWVGGAVPLPVAADAGVVAQALRGSEAALPRGLRERLELTR